LYLDLQPKNLLLCDDVIKLVDFDHAVHQNEADRLTKRYGTEGCAAPEQYTMEALDERTDIYAIGVICESRRCALNKFTSTRKTLILSMFAGFLCLIN